MTGKNNLYPHMAAEEIAVWERWLEIHKPEYEYFQYDVRVGTAVQVADDLEENLKKMAADLSMKRIDVVAWKLGTPTVIEVKKVIGFTALGQAVGYPILFADQLNLKDLPAVIVVGEEITPDMDRILNLMEIGYMLV